MNKFSAPTLAILMAATAMASSPAVAEPEKKTELVAITGEAVDSIQLRHDFNAVWVIDNQNILYRDDSRDYYLVTLKTECSPLEIRNRKFAFHPGSTWKLQQAHAYEVRLEAGRPCEVGRIEQIVDARADQLREAALWRAW